MVEHFGLDTFFYLPDSNGTMNYLPKDPHTFTLATVLAEHKSRVTEPTPILGASNVETLESIIARFKCYSTYEKCDWFLSHLAIETLVYPDLRVEVVVQFSHTSSFKKLPGNIYFMMVLEVCHALFSCKMDEAAASFQALDLGAYPGENISKFANEAQHLIKIMKDGYALPYQLGSQLVTKVCSTQSLYFNRTMFNVMDHVLAVEKSYGPHRDPKALKKVAEYSKYGPLGICVKMRKLF